MSALGAKQTVFRPSPNVSFGSLADIVSIARALNPEPIDDIRTGWLQDFAKKQSKSLAVLRKIVESSA